MRIILFFIKFCLGALVILGLTVVVIFATGSGREWLAQTGMSYLTARSDYEFEVHGLRSQDLNHWQVESLTIAHKGIQLYEAAGIDLYWQPLSLFRGRLLLDEIRAKRIVIVTPPAIESTGGIDHRARVMPVTIHSITIDTLKLPALTEYLPGDFRISGSMDILSGTSLLTADIKISPVTIAAGKLTVSVNIGRQGTGSFSGWYSERPGGPVGDIFNLPQDESFDASFRFNMEHLSEGYRFDVQDLSFAVAHQDINVRGILQQDQAAVKTEHFLIDIDNTRQVLSGSATADGLDLELDLDEAPLALASPWTKFTIPGTTGGHLAVHGSYSDPTITGTLNIHTLYRESALTIDLAGTATLDQLLLDNAVVRSDDSILIRADGKLMPAEGTINLKGNTENISLDQLRGYGLTFPDNVKGKINARTTLQGQWDKPEFEVNGTFTGLYKEEVPVSLKISGNGRPLAPVDGGQDIKTKFDINLVNLILQVRDHTLTGAGHITAEQQPLLVEILDANIGIGGSTHAISGEIREQRMALNLKLVDFPLEILSPLFDLPVTGFTSGTVFLGGAFSEPLLRARVDSDLSWRQLPLQLKTEFIASRKWLEFKRLLVAGSDGTVLASGLIDFEGDETHLEIGADNIDTGLLHGIYGRIPEALQGHLNSDLTVTGTREFPHISGTVEFAGRYRDLPVTLSGAGRGNKRRLFIDKLDISTRNEGRLAVHGKYDSAGFNFDVTAAALPSQLLGINTWELPSGSVDGAVSIRGTFEQPDVTGNFSYVRNPESDDSTELLSAFDAGIKMDASNLEFLLTLAGVNARTGNIDISLPWRVYLDWIDKGASGPAPLAGVVHSEAYLQELCDLFLDPDIHDCKGRLKTNLTMADTIDTPRFDGNIIIEDGYYENMVSGTSLYDVQMDIRALENRIEIVRATAGDGDQGMLELEGGGHWLDEPESLDVNLVLRTRDAHLLRRYDMDGTANGILTLTGDQREMFLSGTLDIIPFNLALEALLQGDIPALNIINDDDQDRRQAASRRKWRLLPAINLNVELTANQQAYLRGGGLEAELQGRILIQGTYPDTVYRGNFRTIRGFARILGKRFNLVGGEIRMEDDIFSLLIPGVYKGKDMEVRAELSGTLDELHLDLSSTPAYPEDEIISQLLFNKSSQNISPLQAIRLANSLNMLKTGGRPLFDPLDKIQKTLTVETLNVEDSASGDGVQLGVGKYIHEKVYVEVETGTGAGDPWQGNIQIELLPNLNLENSVNGESGFGDIELQWKKDY